MTWLEIVLDAGGLAALLGIMWQLGRLAGAMEGAVDRIRSLEAWRNTLVQT